MAWLSAKNTDNSVKDVCNINDFHKLVEENGLLEKFPEIVEYCSTFEPLDNLLFRFLKDCKYKASSALNKLREHCEWRRNVNLEKLVKRSPANILGCDPKTIAKRFPYVEYGFDKKGRRVHYYFAECFDANGILCCTGLDNFMDYQIWIRETSIRKLFAEIENDKSEDYNCKIQKRVSPPYYLTIFDMKGCRLSQVNKNFYRLIRLIMEVDFIQYPGRVSKLIIVNAPFFFSFIWGVIRQTLNTAARKVVVVYRDEVAVMNELLKHVDEQQLPQNFGGKAAALLPHLQEDILKPFSIKSNINSKPTSVVPLLQDESNPWNDDNIDEKKIDLLESGIEENFIAADIVELLNRSDVSADCLRTILVSKIKKISSEHELLESTLLAERQRLREEISNTLKKIDFLAGHAQKCHNKSHQMESTSTTLLRLKEFEILTKQLEQTESQVKLARRYIDHLAEDNNRNLSTLQAEKEILVAQQSRI